MNNQDEPSNWATKDATIPLLLSGVVSVVLCGALCLVMFLSRDLLSNDLAPRLGLIEPTPGPFSCPAIPKGWKEVMHDNFNSNKYDWSLGKDTDAYADTDLRIEDGLLRFDIEANQGVFYYEYPGNKALTDFYLASEVRKVDGPRDAKYGLVFRINNDQLLFFAIQDSGRVYINARDVEGNWRDEPLFLGHSDLINVDKSNELAIFGRGSHYIFCINQYIAGQIDSADYPMGKFGLGVSLKNGGDKATFEFDDFIIYMK